MSPSDSPYTIYSSLQADSKTESYAFLKNFWFWHCSRCALSAVCAKYYCTYRIFEHLDKLGQFWTVLDNFDSFVKTVRSDTCDKTKFMFDEEVLVRIVCNQKD